MMQESNNYMVDNRYPKPQQIVNVPITLYKSIQGKYFVGQTEALWVGSGSNAWAGLVNPCNSDVNLYANVFTISNFSDEYLTAEIWINAELPEEGAISQKVSPANTSINPLPQNKVEIRYSQSTTGVPSKGVNVYQRIVPPKTTLVSEEDGKFIEPPCGSYVVFLKGSSSNPSKAVVALGWWEEPRV